MFHLYSIDVADWSWIVAVRWETAHHYPIIRGTAEEYWEVQHLNLCVLKLKIKNKRREHHQHLLKNIANITSKKKKEYMAWLILHKRSMHLLVISTGCCNQHAKMLLCQIIAKVWPHALNMQDLANVWIPLQGEMRTNYSSDNQTMPHA